MRTHSKWANEQTLEAIWPKSKDLYPTYLKATKPPSV